MGDGKGERKGGRKGGREEGRKGVSSIWVWIGLDC